MWSWGLGFWIFAYKNKIFYPFPFCNRDRGKNPGTSGKQETTGSPDWATAGFKRSRPSPPGERCQYLQYSIWITPGAVCNGVNTENFLRIENIEHVRSVCKWFPFLPKVRDTSKDWVFYSFFIPHCCNNFKLSLSLNFIVDKWVVYTKFSSFEAEENPFPQDFLSSKTREHQLPENTLQSHFTCSSPLLPVGGGCITVCI